MRFEQLHQRFKIMGQWKIDLPAEQDGFQRLLDSLLSVKTDLLRQHVFPPLRQLGEVCVAARVGEPLLWRAGNGSDDAGASYTTFPCRSASR